jgi:hypothetical protein
MVKLNILAFIVLFSSVLFSQPYDTDYHQQQTQLMYKLKLVNAESLRIAGYALSVGGTAAFGYGLYKYVDEIGDYASSPWIIVAALGELAMAGGIVSMAIGFKMKSKYTKLLNNMVFNDMQFYFSGNELGMVYLF